jgi:hypothetical protein
VAERRASAAVRDEAGAVLVIGVFLAVFLVGLLFYVVGIGETVLRRERLGDAADAVSMASAVTHARSMNLIVLLNQVMAALLAVLVALRIVEMLATLAILMLLAAAFVGGEAGLAAIPGLETVRSGANRAYTALDQPIHASLRALHGVAQALRSAGPALAELQAVAVVAELDPKARVTRGFVVPARLALPVENDRFDRLCEHAGKNVAEVAMIPLSRRLPGISGDVEAALGDLAGSASDWFCGRGGQKPPAIRRIVKRVLPTLGARARCEASTHGSGANGSSLDCAEVGRVEAESEPDGTGACRTACGSDGPYEERIEKARDECNPGTRAGLRGFSWQERSARIEFVNRGDGWRPTGRRWNDPPHRVSRDDSSSEHPCGTRQALYSPEFARTLRASPTSSNLVPVCSTPIVLPVGRASGLEVVEVTEVLQLFGCVVSEEREIGGNFDDSARAGDASEEAPERVLGEAVLGGEMFQERAVVQGSEPVAYVEGIVETATWGANGEDPATDIAGLGRFSVAEAEYYFDHDGRTPREEWMWSRRWTARLRRFRSPTRPVGVTPAGDLLAKLGAGLGDVCSH